MCTIPETVLVDLAAISCTVGARSGTCWGLKLRCHILNCKGDTVHGSMQARERASRTCTKHARQRRCGTWHFCHQVHAMSGTLVSAYRQLSCHTEVSNLPTQNQRHICATHVTVTFARPVWISYNTFWLFKSRWAKPSLCTKDIPCKDQVSASHWQNKPHLGCVLTPLELLFPRDAAQWLVPDLSIQ